MDGWMDGWREVGRGIERQRSRERGREPRAHTTDHRPDMLQLLFIKQVMPVKAVQPFQERVPEGVEHAG